MDNFAVLGQLALQLHNELRGLFYLALPVAFALSLAMAWFRHPAGGPDFIESLKRVFIASLLLAAFPEITDAILAISNGLSTKISDMSGLDAILKMAGEKAKSYPMSPMSVVFGIDDLLMSTLSFLSYLILYVARYLMVAIYQFSWVFLLIIAPVVLLFHLFSPKITLNLFRSLIEVASWNVVWAVLSAMLKALPFGNIYATDGSYLTLIVLNFVIAICMLATPLLVRAIVGNGVSAMAGSLGPAVVTAMAMLPAKAAASTAVGRQVLSDTAGYLKTQHQNLTTPKPPRIEKLTPQDFQELSRHHADPPPPPSPSSPNKAV
jgi:hypothetical protein